MTGSQGSKRKGQGNKNGKWSESVIKEEDEEVLDDGIDDGITEGRDSYDVAELDTLRSGSGADGQSTSASV